MNRLPSPFRSVVALLLGLLVLVSTSAVASAAGAVTYNEDGIAVSPLTVAQADGRVTFTWKVDTNRPVAFRYLQIATTGQPGTGFNPGVTVDGSRTFTATQVLPKGTHTSKVVYALPGQTWQNLSAARYTVGAAAVPPTTASPSPATATPGATSAPAASDFNSDGVLLAPVTTSTSGTRVTTTWTVRSNKAVTFRYLQLATTGRPGSGFNSGVTVNGTRTFTTTQSLPTGEHTTRPVYQLAGKAWVNGPATKYTVGNAQPSAPASPAPTPVPVPVPTATPTAPAPVVPTVPAPTASATTGTTSSAPMALPAKVVGGYWMKWSNSRSGNLAAVDRRYNAVLLAFAQGSSGTGAVSFGQNVQSDASFKADVATVRARGQRVIMSIGGEGGLVDVSTTTKRQQFLDSIVALRTQFPLDGIDWDIEGQALHVGNMRWISEQLKARYGKNFAIMMAPQGHLVGYKQLAQQLGNNLDFTGIQFYDYPETTQQARIESVKRRTRELIGTYGIDPSKIGIGMRVFDGSRRYTTDGTATKWFSVKGARDAWIQLEALYPTLRGAYQWEIATDRDLGGRWINEVGTLIP